MDSSSRFSFLPSSVSCPQSFFYLLPHANLSAPSALAVRVTGAGFGRHLDHSDMDPHRQWPLVLHASLGVRQKTWTVSKLRGG